MNRVLLLLVLLFSFNTSAAESELSAEDQAFNEWADQFVSSLEFHEGDVTLKDGIATLSMPEGYVYLDPEDAERLLTEGWGNPPGIESLGMIMPANIHPFAYESWGVIIEYVEDGYISDEDAAEMDFSELLQDIQKAQTEENPVRVEQGYPPINMMGWAEEPHYDAADHKLYWAKNLRFGDAEENTLNYNVRVLGRRGMLVMNAVANMNQLDQIRVDMQEVLAFSNFSEGNRYEDFNPEVDEVAAYGIGAVIAGKLAAKAGLFAKLGILLFALKKYVFVVIVLLGVFLKKLFTGKVGEKTLGS